ncbi:MAG TPA: hypothetical protein VK982_09185 [Bacteroidales bacterium]|nr:hypothetical protein [Bacteroidales bacterium]
MSAKMDIPVKLQNIYFETVEKELGIFHTNQKERISKDEAAEILQENGVEFESIFQVRKEDVVIQLTMEELENFKK